MLTEVEIQTLHDATLVSISVEWEEGKCTLDLRSWEGGIELKQLNAHGLRKLALTHQSPWGESSSINSVSLRRGEDTDHSELEIEMQSGDVLTAWAKRFDLCSSSCIVED